MNLFDLYCKISIDDSGVETGIDKAKQSMSRKFLQVLCNL